MQNIALSNHREEICFFKIILQNDNTIYLNSSNKIINFQSINYYPYSGITILGLDLNDSAQNIVYLHGIFENFGIDNTKNLTNSQWHLTWTKDDFTVIQELLFYIKDITIKDLEFFITLKSETFKYKTPLLKVFSKSCRAQLGDAQCGVNLLNYSIYTNIIEVKDPNIIILEADIDPKKAAYFKYGKVILKKNTHDSENQYSILDCYNNLLKINKHIDFLPEALSLLPNNHSKNSNAILLPGCDKSFQACTYIYKNSLNFRGEPFMPKEKIFKTFE